MTPKQSNSENARESAGAKELLLQGISWLFRAWRGYLIVGALSAMVGGYFTYWVSYSDIVVQRMSDGLEGYVAARDDWGAQTDQILSSARPAARDAQRLPSVEEADALRATVNSLIASINSLPAPTDAIQASGDSYRRALSEVLLRLSQYEGSPEAFTRVVTASQVASARGKEHRDAIEDFLGSSFSALVGSLL